MWMYPPLTLLSVAHYNSQARTHWLELYMYRTIKNRHVLYDYNYAKRNSMTNNILKVTFNLEYETIDIPIHYNQHHTGSSGSFQVWNVVKYLNYTYKLCHTKACVPRPVPLWFVSRYNTITKVLSWIQKKTELSHKCCQTNIFIVILLARFW